MDVFGVRVVGFLPSSRVCSLVRARGVLLGDARLLSIAMFLVSLAVSTWPSDVFLSLVRLRTMVRAFAVPLLVVGVCKVAVDRENGWVAGRRGGL